MNTIQENDLPKTMISIDCKKAMAIKEKLLVYVSDKLTVVPILKSEKILLTKMDDSEIEKTQVLSAVKEFLKSVDIEEFFQVIPKGDDIQIIPLEGKNMKEKLAKLAETRKDLFFECTHCGFLTLYEEEWRAHKLIHYI